VHLNRLIKENDLDMIYIIGPGHGGPGLVAHSYLEGTYTETYPNIERNRDGLKRLFRQFSWPYGIPSHVAPETPGSIHEGGELGYSLAHAYGAAFDNPDLIVACIIGDGEAETGALATSWHSNKFLNPAHDGCVLPILHLNGFKIANPTILARISGEELTALLRGYGYDPLFVEGSEPAAVHHAMAATLDRVLADIRSIQNEARGAQVPKRPHWPMVVFRTRVQRPALANHNCQNEEARAAAATPHHSHADWPPCGGGRSGRAPRSPRGICWCSSRAASTRTEWRTGISMNSSPGKGR
jgi:xylulose-5-phosphate/fructose-6-phosphate phosphoketolase